MAFLNQAERQKLADELKNMDFNKAKRKLYRMDPKGQMAYFRNNQTATTFETRFDLHGLGTRVRLIESEALTPVGGKYKARYHLDEVIVEPTPENRT